MAKIAFHIVEQGLAVSIGGEMATPEQLNKLALALNDMMDTWAVLEQQAETVDDSE